MREMTAAAIIHVQFGYLDIFKLCNNRYLPTYLPNWLVV